MSEAKSFTGVYINLDACYGPDGSLPLVRALTALTGSDDVEVYRGEGFAFALCPVLKDKVYLPEGTVVVIGSDGALKVIG